MRRSLWTALLFVAVAGWSVAGVLAWALAARLGWFGILLIGLVVLVAAQGAEAEEPSVFSATLLRRRLEQRQEASAESRIARWAERLRRQRWLYVVRTVGIALSLLGLNMFVLHQI